MILHDEHTPVRARGVMLPVQADERLLRSSVLHRIALPHSDLHVHVLGLSGAEAQKIEDHELIVRQDDVPLRSHTHTHAHRHTRTQTHTHTHTDTHTQTDRQTHTHTDTHAHRHTHTQTHTHRQTDRHTHTDTHRVILHQLQQLHVCMSCSESEDVSEALTRSYSSRIR